MSAIRRAGEVWEQIKPYAMRDIQAMQSGSKIISSPVGYQITLHAEKTRYYDATSTGLNAAIAAAVSGDMISLPPCSIEGNHSVPAGVSLFGIDRNRSILTGQITLMANTHLGKVSVIRSTYAAGSLYGVILSGNNARVNDCVVDVTNTNEDAIGVYCQAGKVGYVDDCFVSGTGSTAGYGCYVNNGTLYIQGGRITGSTGATGGYQVIYRMAGIENIFKATASITWNYDEIDETIEADVLPAGVDHDLLLHFVTDEHVDHGDVQIIAGNGLTGGGDLLASRTLNLDTPGTLGVASMNDAEDNHTHAITSSSNPGAAEEILATNASGYLQLARLGIGTNPGYPLHVAGDVEIESGGGNDRVRLGAGMRIQSDNYVSQVTGWGISYAGAGDFRYLYADELHAKALIADLEQALAGGQIISKSVAPLEAEFTVPAPEGSAALVVGSFKGFPSFKVFEDGDLIRLRQFERVDDELNITDCWGTVAWASTDTDAKTQTYTFTRSAIPNGGGATNDSTIPAGTLALDYGTSGNGFLESNAIDGAMGENSPYHQVVTWATHPNDTLTVRTRLGNLKGIFNIADEYGLYAGAGVTDADAFLRISNEAVEAHNLPVRMYDGAAATIELEPDTPSLAMGGTLPTGFLIGDGLWMGKDSQYKFRLGAVSGGVLTKGMSWDGSQLVVRGGVVVGNGTGFITPAALHCPFDGPTPYETDFQVNTNGHLGQVATVTGAVIGRKGKFGKSVQVGEAVTNLIANPSFEETVTDGWNINSSDSSATRTKSAVRSMFGAYSVVLRRNTASWCYLRSDPITLADGESCVASAWIWRKETGGTEPKIYLHDGSELVSQSTTAAAYKNWERVSVGYTNSSGSPKDIQVRIAFSNVTGNVFVDGVQFTKSNYPLPYCDGSLGAGHSWSGTAHNSTSSWTGGALQYSVSPRSLDRRGSLCFWFSPALAMDGTYTGEGYKDLVQLLFADNEDDGAVWMRWSDTGDVSLRLIDTAGSYGAADIELSALEWVHIAFSWDAETGESAVYFNGVLQDSSNSFPGFTYGTKTEPLLYLYQAAKGGYWIDDLAVIDHALTAEEIQTIYESDLPLTVTTNTYELMLTGAGKGKVWGHAGGLFAQDSAGNAVFALANENSLSWSGATINTGDLVLGKIASGAANILWDASEGKFLIRENETTQVEIGTDGSLYAGGGNVEINADGIQIVCPATSPIGKSTLTWKNQYGTWGEITSYYVSGSGWMDLKSSYKAASGGGQITFSIDGVDTGATDSHIGYGYSSSDGLHRMYFNGVSVVDIFSGALLVGTGGTVTYLGKSSGDIWANGKLTVYENAWFAKNVSALSFTDRTPFFEGDALAEIMKIRGKKGKIDHASLPEFARKTIRSEVVKDAKRSKPEVMEEEGRDLGAMVSLLTVAVQQLNEKVQELSKKDTK